MAGAIVPDLALPHGEHLASLGLLLGGIGHDDAANGLFAFVETLIDKNEKVLAVNWDDELVKATVLTRDGAVVHPAFAG